MLVRPIGVYALLAGLLAIAGGATARAWLVVRALTVVALPGTQRLVWLVRGHALVAGALWLGVAVSVLQTCIPRDQPAD
jgi:hypothetical protein